MTINHVLDASENNFVLLPCLGLCEATAGGAVPMMTGCDQGIPMSLN